jgi:hypothetical protein
LGIASDTDGSVSVEDVDTAAKRTSGRSAAAHFDKLGAAGPDWRHPRYHARPIDLKQLEDFVSLCDTRSFSRSAVVRNVMLGRLPTSSVSPPVIVVGVGVSNPALPIRDPVMTTSGLASASSSCAVAVATWAGAVEAHAIAKAAAAARGGG